MRKTPLPKARGFISDKYVDERSKSRASTSKHPTFASGFIFSKIQAALEARGSRISFGWPSQAKPKAVRGNHAEIAEQDEAKAGLRRMDGLARPKRIWTRGSKPEAAFNKAFADESCVKTHFIAILKSLANSILNVSQPQKFYSACFKSPT
jgi:hypothetical protein